MIKKTNLLTSLLIMSISAAPAYNQTPMVSKMALMTFQAEMTINVSAPQVWTVLTDIEEARDWYPAWTDASLGRPIDTVGRTIAYTDAWNNKGQSVVIYAAKEKELRLAHVPDDGSYVCQSKFILKPAGESTMVTVIEQYSDDLAVPVDKDTAMQTKTEMEKYLKALKSSCEKVSSR